MENTVNIGRNGGTLKIGNPGNKGGGRLPEELRGRCREALNEALSALEKKIPIMRPADLIRTVELLAKYGIGPAMPEGVIERPAQPGSIDETLRSLATGHRHHPVDTQQVRKWGETN